MGWEGREWEGEVRGWEGMREGWEGMGGGVDGVGVGWAEAKNSISLDCQCNDPQCFFVQVLFLMKGEVAKTLNHFLRVINGSEAVSAQ